MSKRIKLQSNINHLSLSENELPWAFFFFFGARVFHCFLFVFVFSFFLLLQINPIKRKRMNSWLAMMLMSCTENCQWTTHFISLGNEKKKRKRRNNRNNSFKKKKNTLWVLYELTGRRVCLLCFTITKKEKKKKCLNLDYNMSAGGSTKGGEGKPHPFIANYLLLMCAGPAVRHNCST